MADFAVFFGNPASAIVLGAGVEAAGDSPFGLELFHQFVARSFSASSSI
jgi:hypothetical protein